MRNLPPPFIDAITTFNEIASEKKQPLHGRLNRMRSRVKNSYANYSANSKNLESLTPIGINGVREKALLHAYSSATKTMKAMRGKLLFPDIEDFDECPYCGINEPKTLDHYLPKETFPEFSIFPSNLIPICHVCNCQYKGTSYLTPTGSRLFLHSYFDVFPAADFLAADVNVGSKIEIEFKSVQVAGNIYFSSLVKNHFDKLNLIDRFLIKSAAEINRKRATFERFYINNQYMNVASQLNTEAADLRATLSGNHWKVALYEALSKSQDFCDGGFRKQVIRP